MNKVCTKCKIEKNLEEFRKNKNNYDGLETACKECRRLEQRLSYKEKGWQARKKKNVKENLERYQAYAKKWREDNRDKVKAYEYTKYYKDISKTLYRQAKYRSGRKGIEFNISIEDIVMPELCPFFQTPLSFEQREDVGYKNCMFQPSLDRIDPKKGYVKGNIWVISTLANVMKNCATAEQLKIFSTNSLKLLNHGILS